MSHERLPTVGRSRSGALILSLLLATGSCGGSESGAPETSSPAPSEAVVTTRPLEIAERPDPRVTLRADGCTPTIPAAWPADRLPIEVTNEASVAMALAVGTYNAGADRNDLLSYSENLIDLTVRPEFVEVLEIYEVFPGATRSFTFDHGPGRYFVACLRQPSTMIVLDDVVVGD